MLLCVPQCVFWCLSGSCHCNSHKKSTYWSRLRNCTLLGGLHSFNLTLSDIDAHLSHAGTAYRHDTHAHHEACCCMLLNSSWTFFIEKMLHIFKKDMFVKYSTFVKGKSPAEYGLYAQNQQQVIHEWVISWSSVSGQTMALFVTRLFCAVTHLCMALCRHSWTEPINRTTELPPSWGLEPQRSLSDTSTFHGTQAETLAWLQACVAGGCTDCWQSRIFIILMWFLFSCPHSSCILQSPMADANKAKERLLQR